jgi:hypothetical protein
MNTYKKQIKKIFDQNREISCPAFPGEKVVLNSKGLHHIFYKGGIKKFARPEKESAVRASLVPRAIKVLKSMCFAQEESGLIVGKKTIVFWAFEAVVDDRRIKVIVRQIGNGNKHFWSVIPAWRRIRGKIVNAKNDLSKL